MTESAGSFSGFTAIDNVSWWYQKDGQRYGPVNIVELKRLAAAGQLVATDLVWREEYGKSWKRLNQTGINFPPPMPRTQPTAGPAPAAMPLQPVQSPPAQTYDPKWQTVFDAAKVEETTWTLFNRSGTKVSTSERMKLQWKLQSIPGFLFGPLYYFYLRMWRKGILLLALAPITGTIELVVGSSRALNFVIPITCMTLVKRDYYKFCTKGETVWPFLRFSKNAWTDAGLVAAAIAVFVIGVFISDSDDGGTVSRRSSRTTAITKSEESDEQPARSASMSDSEIMQMEQQAGESGNTCTIARYSFPNLFQFRQYGTPLDEAEKYTYNSHAGDRINGFMMETTRKLYENPEGMRAFVANGLWSRACIKFVRGY